MPGGPTDRAEASVAEPPKFLHVDTVEEVEAIHFD